MTRLYAELGLGTTTPTPLKHIHACLVFFVVLVLIAGVYGNHGNRGAPFIGGLGSWAMGMSSAFSKKNKIKGKTTTGK